MPPPKSKPSSGPAEPKASPCENTPTLSVPKAPQTPCTEMAPTGSSMRILSKNSTAPTTKAPPHKPIIKLDTGETHAQEAVMATKPASAPLSVIETSGFLNNAQAVSIAAIAPAAAAIFVTTAMWASASREPTADMVLPGLKPNQP